MSRKRESCHLCDMGRDVKTWFVCKSYALNACKDNLSMTIIHVCDAYKIQGAEGEETE